MAEASSHGVLTPTALEGRVALVTGAARGIGRAIALDLAHAGADIAINDRELDERTDDLARAITALGRRASAHAADVADQSAVAAMVAAVVAAHGRLDILVNNAGLQIWEPFLHITEAALGRILDVDLKGVVWCGQATAHQMIRQGTGGRIVNISSVHAVTSWATAAAYDAAKAGVARLTATMALELAPHGITVNAVGPGWVDTPINARFLRTPEERAAVAASIPLGRIARPEEIGALVAVLCSPVAAYMTGAFLLIDGGLALGIRPASPEADGG